MADPTGLMAGKTVLVTGGTGGQHTLDDDPVAA